MTTGKEELIAELRREDAFPVFVTGAGISLASGIPTFRGDDPDAIWANDVLEMGTKRYFERDPVKQWQWYLQRFEACLGCEPNPGHTALAELEQLLTGRGARFHLITQNVDGLHIEAGTKSITEIHGAARKMRCSKRSCVNGAPKGFLPWDTELFRKFRDNPTFENLPRCPECNKLYRAHVLWFDEYYTDHDDYGLDNLVKLVGQATSVVFVGTSFSVGITAMIVGATHDLNLPVYVIDPNMTSDHVWAATQGGVLIPESSETYLPELVKNLRTE